MASLLLPGLLVSVFTLQAADGPSPEDLVTRLGAPRHAEREAAGDALVKIGRAAIPALMKARASRDPEVRQRAETLAAQIAAMAIVRATPVRLALHDRPLAEAVAAIGKASGMTLTPVDSRTRGGVEPSWPERRVTLEAAEPVPFWEAVDQLCKAGGLQRIYPREIQSFSQFGPSFELPLMEGPARPPASDLGALRVELLRVRHRGVREFGEEGSPFAPIHHVMDRREVPQTGVTVGFSYHAELLVSAEPRLRIFGVGSVEEAEAIDDQGRSLLETPTAEEQEQKRVFLKMNPQLDPKLHPALRFAAGFNRSQQSWVVSLPLSYPSPPAQRIARLRGVLPLLVLERGPDPLVFNLKGAAGQTFSSGPTRITVHAVTAGAGQDPRIDLTLEDAPEENGQTLNVSTKDGVRLDVLRPIDLMEIRLEALNERGERLPWGFMRPPAQGAHGRVEIIIRRRGPQPNRPENLRLRYWEVIGAATELPFSFSDVPTP